MAGSEAAKAIMYFRMLFDELGQKCAGETPCFIDNTAARNLAYNPEHHRKTKHVARRHYFIRECVDAAEICVPFVPSKDNKANFYTKSFGPLDFFRLRKLVMNEK